MSTQMHTAEELREVFDLLDKDGSGSLDREEIQDLAARLGKHLTSSQIDEAMLEMVRAATDWFIMSNTTA
jgi:Ca2+-binding EF-hand superfamily protein